MVDLAYFCEIQIKTRIGKLYRIQPEIYLFCTLEDGGKSMLCYVCYRPALILGVCIAGEGV